MAHNCIDWTANPPTRKIPLLILTHGDEHVYTVVPQELGTLKEVARKEFDLGGAEIFFSSSCLNLCHGLPARITESAWEHMSPYIGCATVEIIGPRAVPLQGVSRQVQSAASANAQDGRDSSAKRTSSSNTGNGDENEQLDHGLGNKSDALAKEAVRDEQRALSDHGNEEREGASAPEDQREEPWEEEVSAVLPQKSRYRRRVVSEAEDEGEESEREHDVPARSQVPPVASPPKLTQPSKEVKKKGGSGYRSQPDLGSDEPSHQPSKLIKQEKLDDGYQQSHTESQYEAKTQTRGESSGNPKLMIRVAHRSSKQESKFTTKSTTKVAKVLGAVCKSFSLDVDQATLYLIVPMEDEDGQVENLFPCDRSDTIARAGAELDTESRFLLKIAGEV